MLVSSDSPNPRNSGIYRFIHTPGGRFERHALDPAGGLHPGLTVGQLFLERHFSPHTRRKYAALQAVQVTWFDAVAPGGTPAAEYVPLFAKFLESHWGCRVRKRDHDSYLVTPRTCSATNIRAVIAAGQAYFDAQIEYGLLALARNPLRLACPRTAQGRQIWQFGPFVVRGGPWQPRYAFVPGLRDQISAGAREDGWAEAPLCILDGLFDSGCRLHELCAQTLGDWAVSNCGRWSHACSKGSEGRRVKVLALSDATARHWRVYFDGTRRQCDPARMTLAEYLEAGRAGRLDLHQVPLFLTARGAPLRPDPFRAVYWTPTARRLGLHVGPHAARHWYVTMKIIEIRRAPCSEAEKARRFDDLVAYMHWATPETVQTYNHVLGLYDGLCTAARTAPSAEEIRSAEDLLTKSPLFQRLIGKGE